MARKVSSMESLLSDVDNETSSMTISIDEQQKQNKSLKNSNDFIQNYVSNILRKHQQKDGEPVDLQTIRIESRGSNYQNISAFRQFHSNVEETTRTNTQRPESSNLSMLEDEKLLQKDWSKEEIDDSNESIAELNLDPNPIVEQRESSAQIYKQKVFLRQLQPPTPQPVEIQVKEVLIDPPKPKSPLEIRVGLREPRTPSPIVIKSTPPQPPPNPMEQPIIYNKYIPPPKQPPQQIIIHRHPDLPPKPRPIIIEQWLPYKPAPKRIIKESLPPEARQTPPAPHNLIVSYSKPRALIQVELVRLPVVKVDPETYQQMNNDGQQSIQQPTIFNSQGDYLDEQRFSRENQTINQFHWRI